MGPGAEPRPKTNLVHSKAVRKPLVEIILNIPSTMFYSKTIKNLALANMTEWRRQSVAQRGGVGGAGSPLSKSANVICFDRLTF